MFIAFDEDNKIICSDDAERGREYFCPVCGEKVVFRCGVHNVPHFSHMRDSECLDTWHYEMSEWHRQWQSQFPIETREVIVKNADGIVHRADVLIGHTVIEFQHSNMSSQEFSQRNDFYTKCGYHVIWLFDVTKEYTEYRIVRYGTNENQFRWSWGSTTLDGFYPQYENQIDIYYQFVNLPFDIGELEGAIAKLAWRPVDGKRMKIFRIKENEWFAPFEFVGLYYQSDEYKEWKKKEEEKASVHVFDIYQDKPYKYSCVIKVSKIGKTVDALKEELLSNIQTKLSSGYMYLHAPQEYIFKYMGEDENTFLFRLTIRMINEANVDSETCINDITSLLIQADSRIKNVEEQTILGWSIPEMMKKLNVKGAAFINIVTGTDVYIPNNSFFKDYKGERVMGKLKRSYGNTYNYSLREVYYADKPQWLIKFVTK